MSASVHLQCCFHHLLPETQTAQCETQLDNHKLKFDKAARKHVVEPRRGLETQSGYSAEAGGAPAKSARNEPQRTSSDPTSPPPPKKRGKPANPQANALHISAPNPTRLLQDVLAAMAMHFGGVKSASLPHAEAILAGREEWVHVMSRRKV